MSALQRPRYVTRSNEQAFPPPYLQAGCQLYGFWIRATEEKLQACCERFLQRPSRGAVRVTVAAPFVFLYFCSFARTQSLHPTEGERGWLGENECGLWIPVMYEANAAPPSFAFFPFMMFVDSGPAAISGREVLGFPKEIGHITLPGDGALPSLFAVDALAFLQQGRKHAGRFTKLIELRMSTEAPRLQACSMLREVFPFIRPLLRPLRRRRGRIPLLLLKQIRDAVAPELACHQSVLACTPDSIALRSLRVLQGSYQIEFHPCASHPIVEDLGIETTSLGAARGFFVDMDFTLGQTEILWEAQ